MDNRGLLDLMISLLPASSRTKPGGASNAGGIAAGIKLTEKIKLINAFEREEDLFLQSKNDIEKIINRRLNTFWDASDIQDRAGRIDTVCKMRGIKWVSWASPEYPPLLREIYDPPSVIYYRGNLPNPNKPLLGMVGTRKPSQAASEQAYKIAGNIGRAGVSVISGLALGIDAMSHRGNLISSAAGYAVLGCGIDEIYPSSNRPLAKRILDSGGALISEYPPGVRPCKWTFPARNRIISALSRSVIIVEAPKKSGALITASFALEHGKDLWVASCGVQEGAFDRSGTIKLADDGAEIIYSAIDVLEKWNYEIENVKKKEEAFSPAAKLSAGAAWNTNRSEFIASAAEFLKIEI